MVCVGAQGGVAAEGMAEQGAAVVCGNWGVKIQGCWSCRRGQAGLRGGQETFSLRAMVVGLWGGAESGTPEGGSEADNNDAFKNTSSYLQMFFNVLFVSHKQCSSSLFHFGWKNTLRLKLRHTVTLCNRDDKKRDYMLGLKRSHRCRWYKLRSRVQLNIVITDLN